MKPRRFFVEAEVLGELRDAVPDLIDRLHDDGSSMCLGVARGAGAGAGTGYWSLAASLNVCNDSEMTSPGIIGCSTAGVWNRCNRLAPRT